MRADDVGPGLLGLARLIALREYSYAHDAAGPVRQHGGPAHDLIGLARVDTQAQVQFDRAVEGGVANPFQQVDSFARPVQAPGLDQRLHAAILLAVLRHLSHYLPWCSRAA